MNENTTNEVDYTSNQINEKKKKELKEYTKNLCILLRDEDLLLFSCIYNSSHDFMVKIYLFDMFIVVYYLYVDYEKKL